MEYHFFVALVGALLNMILSVTIPCLLKRSKQPFLNDVKKVFQTNREVIIASSLIVAITIYLALRVSPDLESMMTEVSDYLYDAKPSSQPNLNGLSKLGQLNSIN